MQSTTSQASEYRSTVPTIYSMCIAWNRTRYYQYRHTCMSDESASMGRNFCSRAVEAHSIHATLYIRIKDELQASRQAEEALVERGLQAS